MPVKYESSLPSSPEDLPRGNERHLKQEPLEGTPDEQQDEVFDLIDRIGREEEELEVPSPEVARIVPTEGPLHGGIEVTVLGTNFYNGVRVMFGDNEALSTHYWGPTTLICILPPSVSPGLVPVTVKDNSSQKQSLDFPSHHSSPNYQMANHQNNQSSPAGVVPNSSDSGVSVNSDEFMTPPPHENPTQDEIDFVDSILNTDVVMFNYRDETDKELLELALQIVGMKLTGKTESAKHIALAILNQVNLQNSGNKQNSSVEQTVMDTLNIAQHTATDYSLNLSLRSKTSHSVLHLATILNMEALCATLIRMRVPLHLVDRNGFTALHFASWMGQANLVKLLSRAGASQTARNAYGQTPRDLTHPKLNGIWEAISLSIPIELTDDSLVELAPSPPLLAQPSDLAAIPPLHHLPPPMIKPTTATLFRPTIGKSTSSESLGSSSSSGDLGNLDYVTYRGRPSKVEKQRRRKRDRMTYNFWIPFFLVVAALVLFQVFSVDQTHLESLPDFGLSFSQPSY